MLKRAVVCVCVLQACGKGAWAPEPVDKIVQSKVCGVGFTMQVPTSWKFDPALGTAESDPEALAKRWRSETDSPSVTITCGLRPETTLDGYLRRAMFDVSTDTVVKKEQTVDGFLVVSRSGNEMFRVNLQKAKGDDALECRAAFLSKTGVSSPDTAMTWLERICGSLKLL